VYTRKRDYILIVAHKLAGVHHPLRKVYLAAKCNAVSPVV